MEDAMKTRIGAREIALALIALSLPVVLYFVALEPRAFAGVWWYGYSGAIVSPEPGAAKAPLFSVSETRGAVQSGTGGEVQLFNGVLKLTAGGLSSPTPGFSFGHLPSYNNNHEGGTAGADDGNADLPNGWNWYSGFYQLIEKSGSLIRSVGAGTASSDYELSAGVYYGKHGVDARIKKVGSEFWLHATSGTTAIFYDFTQTYKPGALKKIADAAGNKLEATYFSDSYTPTALRGRLEKVELKSAGGSLRQTWSYSYLTSGALAGKVQKVEVKDSSGYTVLGESQFAYYGDGGSYASGSGKDGDLMKITVKERDSNGLNITRNTLFRYWMGAWSAEHPGADHKLRYVVGPQSYADLAAAISPTDPLSAADEDLAEHADYALEFSAGGFVTKAEIQGGGCSCASGQGEYLFSYTTNPSWTPSSSLSTWRTSVTQTNPDGSLRIVDVNGVGSILNDVLQTDSSLEPANGDQRWISAYSLDAAGRVVAIYHPSACQSYSESGHSVALKTSAGLAEVFTYDSNGNLTERKLKQVSSGQDYWLEKRGYTSKSLGDNTIYLPNSIKTYLTETTTDSGGIETQIGYTYHPDSYDLDGDANSAEDSLAVKETTVTLPAVPTAESGENVPHTHKYYFDALGQLQWEKDERGSITFRDYDAALGLLTRQIVDLDTDSFTPSPPSGFSSSVGLSLETTFSYALDGKRTETLDPELRKEKYHYTKLSGGQPVTVAYPHVGTSTVTGPASIQVFDLDGNVITTALGVSDDGDSNLDDDFDETQTTLEAAWVGTDTLFQRTESVFENGQKTKTLQWTDAEDTSAAKYTTLYGYDDMGRLARVKDAGGTITRSYFTVAGRLAERHVGTNDYLLGDELGEPSGTNNMTRVEELFYDDEEDSATNVGDGNLSFLKRHVDDSGSASRDSAFSYDWRNRRTKTDGEEEYFEKRVYDNLERVTTLERYAASESASNLRAKSQTKFDARGRVYQQIVHEVDPASGTIDDALTTNLWYDARGDLLKERQPSGLFAKHLYDGARRLDESYVSYDTDETAYADADDVVGDIVVSQVEYDRDKVGNAILETRWERKPTTSASGKLTTSSGERYYVASWYDVLQRLEAVANYGTNGGSTLTRPSTPPARSDTVLVTDYSYTETGEIEETTDPEARIERRSYDNLGRLTSVISNYLNGTPGDNAAEDDDRKEEREYDSSSHVVKRKVYTTSASDPQTTEWVYGVQKGSFPDSKLASNDLVKTLKYADPSSGNPSSSSDDQEVFAYNAQGDKIYLKDPIGNVHELDFDELGRQSADKVTTLITGVDGAIRRISRTYDALDRPKKITSFDAATGGNVKNEVELVYNGFSQVKESKQAHTGAVDANTLKVLYTWSEADGTPADPISRLKSIQYPVSNRNVYLHYDDPSGATDYSKLDWILERASAVSNNSSASSDRVADYSYQGQSRVTERLSQEQPNTPSSKDIKVAYTFDRFGRIDTLKAEGAGGTADVNNFKYGYNRNSSVLWREENFFSAKDELYSYDLLDRLDVFKRGDLNAGRTDITTPVRSQDWGLDLVGNWKTIATDGSSVNRTHNFSNEITDVDTGFSGQDPSYDKNGNTTKIQRPTPQARDFSFDAWNRLRTVSLSGITLGDYYYDGLNRRIRDLSATGTDFYYSEAWQLLSERNGPSASDKTLKEYVWGLQYLDEILERDEDKNADGDTRDAGDESLYYVQDANWNVHSLCDENGDPVERVLYDPYGLPSFFDGSWGTRSSSAYSNRILFTGRLWSAASYSYDYRHREQSPYLGRFLQRDPIGVWGDDVGGGNGYAYVGNQPVAATDALGLFSIPRHAEMTWDCCREVTLLGCRNACDKLSYFAGQWADSDAPRAQHRDNAAQHCMASPRKDAEGKYTREEKTDAERWKEVLDWRFDKQNDILDANTCDDILREVGELLHHMQDCEAPAHQDANGDPATWRYDSLVEFILRDMPGAIRHGFSDATASTETAKRRTRDVLKEWKRRIQEKCCPIRWQHPIMQATYERHLKRDPFLTRRRI
jgi:RHS repeat-associated protein